MYAAAGGASLASRQARQKKKKLIKNDRLQQLKVTGGEQKQRQFQNYTDSKIKLSRVERNALKPPSLQPERRHSTSHLKEPSRARIKESPSVLIPIPNHLNQSQHPPLTPSTLIREHEPFPDQLPQIFIPEGDKLERRCSFVRQVEEMERCQEEGLLDRCNHICNYDSKERPFESTGNYFSEFHRSAFGSLDYPFSEGRTAWQERQGGRRCSLSEEAHQHRLRQVEAHHRWMKRNRIHDASYGGESEENIFAAYQQSAAANALLYAGLGTTAIGSVVFFVGSGDKGFKTLELRLIGPTLVACGLLCCLIRVLLCACPSNCLRGRQKTKTRLKPGCPHGSSRFNLERRREKTIDFVQVDQNASLVEKQKKRVSIAQAGPSMSSEAADAMAVEGGSRPPPPAYPQPLPLINVPEFADFGVQADGSIEMQNLEFSLDLESVSSEEDNIFGVGEPPPSKLTRTRVPVHASGTEARRDADDDDVETCLSVVVEKPDPPHSGILLSPLQLGQ